MLTLLVQVVNEPLAQALRLSRVGVGKDNVDVVALWLASSVSR